MAYPIRYSTKAYNEYESILEYVTGKFGIAKTIEVNIYFENYRYDCYKSLYVPLLKQKGKS